MSKGIKMLEDAMTEQQEIIDSKGNQYNRCKLDGMKDAVCYLGYYFIFRDDKYQIFKREGA